MVKMAVCSTHRELLVSDGSESNPVLGVLPAIFAVPRHEHQEEWFHPRGLLLPRIVLLDLLLRESLLLKQ
jgi:hypothetical protein